MNADRAGAGTVSAQAAAVDVARERARTVGVRHAHHLNSAGAALPTVAVVDEVVAHLRREENEGGYEAASAVSGRIEEVYAGAARVVGAAAEEIALADSATSGLRVIVDALRVDRSTRLLVSRSTYVSHALHLLSLAQDTGAELVVVPSGADGAVDLERLERLLTGGPRDVVCVAHVPTSSGLVEPVRDIGALTRRSGAIYLLDATQSVGHLRVDVDEIGCDALVTTGRKFLRAPRGTGFAYIRGTLLDGLAPVAPDVRGAVWTGSREWSLSPTARRFETWESSVAGRLGLGVALRELLARGVDATAAYLRGTATLLRRGLAAVDGVTVQDPPSCASGIVTFTVDALGAEAVSQRLAARGVRTVAVPASHGQWDLGARGVPAVVRASVHVYNDDTDADALLDAVAEIARGAGA
ncbi:aminotransferase class V-fold PLP-dependent enzyme [Phytohabitans sp. ZYX-F-186]|uniref:Aminotransferase class V-fold PLP-dependent enzyme n=1 Tax=Phytohabitans maris TaxID=3071409 RepID=A0ABU0Z9D3_9ACTN|nr:aminotransferase class V-fold PLP-dependent enzyme [Phytohabitans sp. ZYX-F-186]MDQ7903660.1 aminotransferase class V-fold PLP-dependent enzyme [Phytohabitans sp. ZYX-F-186]